MNTQIFKKAEQAVNLLKEKNLKIATAESCTGGMVASYITSVSGVSKVFELGITSYTNDIKNKFLKVDTDTLEKYGAVSHQTAHQMANNIRTLSNADIGVSVTGVAGPDGQEGHPPGMVFIGLSDKNSTITKQLDIDPKSRNFVREQTVINLFDLIIEHLK